MTKKFGCFIYLIFVFISFLSCSKDSLVNNDNVFRYNEHSNISSLDPAFASTLRNIWPVNQLFNGLVQLDDSLNIKPDLSESWEISKDGMTYLFKIKFFSSSICACKLAICLSFSFSCSASSFIASLCNPVTCAYLTPHSSTSSA